MAIPIPDTTGRQITPTVHKKVSKATDPSTTTLPFPFAVCILGASRGIGAHISYAYAQAGASSIIVTGRDSSALENTAKEARRVAKRSDCQVVPATCDVTSDADFASLAQKIKTEVGRLDVLIISAAHFGETAIRVTEGDPSHFQNVVDTDIVGAYLAAHHLLPIILGSKGSDAAKAMIAIGGGGAWVTEGIIAHAAHCVSKLGQARLMELIANDFAKEEKLLVVTMRPGLVWTDSSAASPKEFHQSPKESYLTDDIGLAGGFCVWLTKTKEDRLWLNGRFLSATWDVDELLSMQKVIVEKDMLKARIAVE
ncbi:MAG: hypothetical protein Q9220_005487 [cf. Caloplaca sp. 1 TL-2023]